MNVNREKRKHDGDNDGDNDDTQNKRPLYEEGEGEEMEEQIEPISGPVMKESPYMLDVTNVTEGEGEGEKDVYVTNKEGEGEVLTPTPLEVELLTNELSLISEQTLDTELLTKKDIENITNVLMSNPGTDKNKYNELISYLISLDLYDKNIETSSERIIKEFIPRRLPGKTYCIKSFYNMLDPILLTYIVYCVSNKYPSVNIFPSVNYCITKILYYPSLNITIKSVKQGINVIVVTFKKNIDSKTFNVYYQYFDNGECNIITTQVIFEVLNSIGMLSHHDQPHQPQPHIKFNYKVGSSSTTIHSFNAPYSSQDRGYNLYDLYESKSKFTGKIVSVVGPKLDRTPMDNSFTIKSLDSILGSDLTRQTFILSSLTDKITTLTGTEYASLDLETATAVISRSNSHPDSKELLGQFYTRQKGIFDAFKANSISIKDKILGLGLGLADRAKFTEFYKNKVLLGILLDSIDMIHDFRLCSDFLKNILTTYASDQSLPEFIDIAFFRKEIDDLIKFMCSSPPIPMINVDKSHIFCDSVFNKHIEALRSIGMTIPSIPEEIKDVTKNSDTLRDLLTVNCGILLDQANSQSYFESFTKCIIAESIGGEPRETTKLSSIDGAPGFISNHTRTFKYICFFGGLVLAVISIGTDQSPSSDTFISLKFNINTWKLDVDGKTWILNIKPGGNMATQLTKTKILTLNLPYKSGSSIIIDALSSMLPSIFHGSTIRTELKSTSIYKFDNDIDPTININDGHPITQDNNKIIATNVEIPGNYETSSNDFKFLLMCFKTVCDKFCTPELLLPFNQAPKIIITTDSYVWMWLFYSYISGEIDFFPLVARKQTGGNMRSRWSIRPPMITNNQQIIDCLVNLQLYVERLYVDIWLSLNKEVGLYLDAKGHDTYNNIYYELLAYKLIEREYPQFIHECKNLRNAAQELMHDIIHNGDGDIPSLLNRLFQFKKIYNVTFSCFDKCRENQSTLYIFSGLRIVSETNKDVDGNDVLLPYDNNICLLHNLYDIGQRAPDKRIHNGNNNTRLLISDKCFAEFKQKCEDSLIDFRYYMFNPTEPLTKLKNNDAVIQEKIKEFIDKTNLLNAALIAEEMRKQTAIKAANAYLKFSNITKKDQTSKIEKEVAMLRDEYADKFTNEIELNKFIAFYKKTRQTDLDITTEDIYTNFQELLLPKQKPKKELTYILVEGSFPIEFLIQLAFRRIYDVLLIMTSNGDQQDIFDYTYLVLYDVATKIFIFKDSDTKYTQSENNFLISKILMVLVLSIYQLIPDNMNTVYLHFINVIFDKIVKDVNDEFKRDGSKGDEICPKFEKIIQLLSTIAELPGVNELECLIIIEEEINDIFKECNHDFPSISEVGSPRSDYGSPQHSQGFQFTQDSPHHQSHSQYYDLSHGISHHGISHHGISHHGISHSFLQQLQSPLSERQFSQSTTCSTSSLSKAKYRVEHYGENEPCLVEFITNLSVDTELNGIGLVNDFDDGISQQIDKITTTIDDVELLLQFNGSLTQQKNDRVNDDIFLKRLYIISTNNQKFNNEEEETEFFMSNNDIKEFIDAMKQESITIKELFLNLSQDDFNKLTNNGHNFSIILFMFKLYNEGDLSTDRLYAISNILISDSVPNPNPDPDPDTNTDYTNSRLIPMLITAKSREEFENMFQNTFDIDRNRDFEDSDETEESALGSTEDRKQILLEDIFRFLNSKATSEVDYQTHMEFYSRQIKDSMDIISKLNIEQLTRLNTSLKNSEKINFTSLKDDIKNFRGGNKQSKNKRNISKHKHTKNKNKNKNKQNKNKQIKTKKHNRTKIHRITKKSRFL